MREVRSFGSAEGNSDDAVRQILQAARTKLPMEIRFAVDDSTRFRMSLRDRDLLLEAVPGFLFERIRRPEVRGIFSEAALQVLGTPIAVQVLELKPDQPAVRDLNELKRFPEVTFLS